MSKENCLICGKPIRYFKEQKEMTCSICGNRFFSNAQCEDGHFICDSCHGQKGIDAIRRTCLETKSKNPIAIIREIMRDPYIYMHGPEHHIMVGASLLTAYRNAGGNIQLEKCLDEMIKRGGQIPGGFCGLWGCCGAAVSTGIFLSIAIEATPLSGREWGLAQQGTAAALGEIASYGGPRCCKRDSFTSILSAVKFVREHLGVEMEGGSRPIHCEFSAYNAECLGKKCPFHKDREREV
ncbi:DUF5714 domain-containing protein [Anaerovorax odorimutans]|uniref:DUF5714 domain-containing protein n=1 Tax=Anaerovorax odorimutans TaxID=109327 RepID=A0ABT1RNT8_9FIRM|nr:DUF5714 domain-containing protein [Anaerovorax odorimutans]MCQ4636840.1 DUF5714 domain-containing protein [Anaerovorax odorimutans]